MATGKRGVRTRGDGGLYQRKSDGLWVGSVELGFAADGRRLRKTVSAKTQAEALKKLRALRRTVEDYGSAPKGHTTVAAWLDRWATDIAPAHIKPRTLEGYRTVIKFHLVPTLGKRRLDRLETQHIRDMHTAMRRGLDTPGGKGKPLAETTIIKAHRVLSVALTSAMDEGLLLRNVAKVVRAPAKNASDRGALTNHQARQLLAANLDQPDVSRWFASLLTGARQGELLGLQWDRVDLDAGVADLSWQLQRLKHRHGCLLHGDDLPASRRASVKVPGHLERWPCGFIQAKVCPQVRLDVRRGYEYTQLWSSLSLTRPKSAAGTRLVPLVDPVVQALRRHREATADLQNPHDLVWTRPDGRPMDPKQDWSAWTRALDRAGLEHLPLHSARHTTVTLLMESGTNNTVTMSLVGHSDVVVTQGYQHTDITQQRIALQRVSDRLALTAG